MSNDKRVVAVLIALLIVMCFSSAAAQESMPRANANVSIHSKIDENGTRLRDITITLQNPHDSEVDIRIFISHFDSTAFFNNVSIDWGTVEFDGRSLVIKGLLPANTEREIIEIHALEALASDCDSLIFRAYPITLGRVNVSCMLKTNVYNSSIDDSKSSCEIIGMRKTGRYEPIFSETLSPQHVYKDRVFWRFDGSSIQKSIDEANYYEIDYYVPIKKSVVYSYHPFLIFGALGLGVLSLILVFMFHSSKQDRGNLHY